MKWKGMYRFILRNKQTIVKYLFLLPSFLGVMLIILLPFLDVVRRSFFSAMSGQWKGVTNYSRIFSNEAFGLATVNTLRFVCLAVPLLLTLSLLVAILIRNFKGVNYIKTLFLLPLAMPAATVVVIWKMIFSRQGFLNGLLDTHISFMGTDYAFYILVASYIWKNLGYTLVLWLVGLSAIPHDLTEAAMVDGANRRQCFFYITLPNLKGCAYTITILSFLNSFKVYREAYLVSGAYPHSCMYLLQHLFNNWFNNLDFDKLSAGAVMLALVLGGGAMILQKLWDEDATERKGLVRRIRLKYTWRSRG